MRTWVPVRERGGARSNALSDRFRGHIGLAAGGRANKEGEKGDMSNLNGSWTLEMRTLLGSRKGRLRLETDGSSATGALVGERVTLDIKDGKVRDNVVRWESLVSMPLLPRKRKLVCTATIEGDTIAGTIEGPRRQLATFTGSRSE